MCEFNYFDFIAPFEDECLYSWAIRMLKFYSPTHNLCSLAEKDALRLFGINYPPKFYFPRGIEYLIENHDFGMLTKFSSYKAVLDNMTVLPFYLAFKEDRESFYDNLINFSTQHNVEHLVGVQQRNTHMEGKCFMKFCPQCVEESSEMYLKTEHQIPGNFVCSTHRVPLNYLVYIPRWRHLDFAKRILRAKSFELTKEQFKIALRISQMIHRISKEGLLVTVSDLKIIIRSKLRKLGYLNEEFAFYDFSFFLKNFERENYFIVNDKAYTLFNLIYDQSVPLNSLYYVLMIEFLFEDLDALYKYRPEFPHRAIIKKFSVMTWDLKTRFTCAFYQQTMGKKYLDEYSIIGQTNTEVVIKHKICGQYFCNSLKNRKLSRCKECKSTSSYLDRNLVNLEDEKINDPEFIKFLSTWEYGELHNRKEKQIRNYCVAGRIEGAIQIGAKNWLVPENAPYPKDRRVKRYKAE